MTRTTVRKSWALTGAMTVLFATAACGDRDRNDNTMIGDSVAATSTSGGTLANTDDVDIEELTLGRGTSANGTVSEKTDEFRPTDAIVAVVETDDDDAGKELVARWTFGDNDQLVAEQREIVATGNDARTTFRLTKDSAWPTGKYHVRIMHNGKELKSADFTVKN
jgi:hypothetical protein